MPDSDGERREGADPGTALPAGQSDRLQEQVQEALEHLYDYAYLQNHPLSVALGETTPAWNRGAALHRVLVEAIESLKPPPGTPPHSQLWRRYRHALLRYIEGATVVRLAEELGVSERQARRDNHEALQAIASLLRERFPQAGLGARAIATSSERKASSAIGVAAGEDQSEANGALADMGLDEEVARIGTLAAHGFTRIEDIVRGVQDTVAKLAEGKNVVLQLRTSPGLLPTSAERTVVRQIVLNTILWVLDLASPGSAVELTAVADRRELTLSATIALSEAESDGIVARWEGEERPAIASRLATLQGGALRLERQGKTLEVRLTLPAATLPTVLLVDDNPGLLRLLRRYLSGSPYTVVEARTADEALRLAQEVQPDAITLDVMMPTIDGWELLQMLRAQPATRHIPVIVCSVLKERSLALSLGAAGFLEKPVTQDALLQALAELNLGAKGSDCPARP